MAPYTVHKGRRYAATVRLSFFQSVASNEIVADKFREVGFTNVEVTGSGRTRHAKGSWTHDDVSAEIPDEVSDIRDVGLIEV